MSWSAGYTMNGGDDTALGEGSFSFGMDLLYEFAQGEMKQADLSELSDWETLLEDISDIRDDKGIMGDPDQWEDEDFYGPNVTYWIVKN